MGADAVVVRHGASGAPHRLAHSGWVALQRRQRRRRHPRAPDPGAARRVHDVAAPRQSSGGLDGRRVAIVGDVLHSRVARSNALLLQHPRRRGHPGRAADAAAGRRRGLAGRDVVRPRQRAAQGRRGDDAAGPAGADERRRSSRPRASTRRRYGLDGRRMAMLQDHTIVMHPGPMIRGMEITADVADSDRSVIVEQVTNGVAVRMAVLYLLLGGSPSRRVDAEERRVSTLPDQERPRSSAASRPTCCCDGRRDRRDRRRAAPADAEVDRRRPG